MPHHTRRRGSLARIASVSTKVTRSEFEAFRARAGTETVSEWARTILLRELQDSTPADALLLSELLATQRLLLNLHNGRQWDAQSIKQLQEEIDRDKLQRAYERLGRGDVR
jgi:hypothetical protein